MATAKLMPINLPDFGMPDEMPELDAKLYLARFGRMLDRAWAAGLDALVVYADREHCANMAWATGFDPRFEEALLVCARNAGPVFVTGPENLGPAGISPIDAKVELYPPFGLMGQNRDETPDFGQLLRGCGLADGEAIGVAGWKYYGATEFPDPHSRLEIPSVIADVLRAIAGQRGRVTNAGALFMDPETGLRATLEIGELARFEYAACHTSEAIKRVVLGTKPGMREFDAAALMRPIGLPLSCHTMFSSGQRAWHGLLSPTSKCLERGEAVTAAYGVHGALNCRNGWLVEGPEELAPEIRDYVEKLVAPYFEAVAWWLETVGIGVAGGELHAGMMARIGDPFFGVSLNPGHLIHLDEWMHSPVAAGSKAQIRSGMALQVDVIPATGGPYFTSNMEDGIAILDEAGRAQFADEHPAAWRRIQERREFMASALGIRLKPEVLPFSNLASFLPPFWLSPGMAMTLR